MKASTFRRALAGCHNKATGGGETELWAEPGGAVSWGVDLRGRKFPVAADGPGCGGIRGDLFARSKARAEEGEERPAASERVSLRRGSRGEPPHEKEGPRLVADYGRFGVSALKRPASQLLSSDAYQRENRRSEGPPARHV